MTSPHRSESLAGQKLLGLLRRNRDVKNGMMFFRQCSCWFPDGKTVSDWERPNVSKPLRGYSGRGFDSRRLHQPWFSVECPARIESLAHYTRTSSSGSPFGLGESVGGGGRRNASGIVMSGGLDDVAETVIARAAALCARA